MQHQRDSVIFVMLRIPADVTDSPYCFCRLLLTGKGTQRKNELMCDVMKMGCSCREKYFEKFYWLDELFAFGVVLISEIVF